MDLTTPAPPPKPVPPPPEIMPDLGLTEAWWAAVEAEADRLSPARPEPLRLSAVERSMVRPDVAAAVAASRTGGHDA